MQRDAPGPSSRANCADLRKISPAVTPTLIEGVEMTMLPAAYTLRLCARSMPRDKGRGTGVEGKIPRHLTLVTHRSYGADTIYTMLFP